MAAVMTEDPAELRHQRARRFLRRLVDRPFVTIVMNEEGGTDIYTKGLSEEDLRIIKLALDRTDDQEE